jgi:hypothetical protein
MPSRRLSGWPSAVPSEFLNGRLNLSSSNVATSSLPRAFPITHVTEVWESVGSNETLAHMLPDVLVVASMVAAIALLQTDGHYSYITV